MSTVEKKKLLLKRLEQLENSTMEEYFRLTSSWGLSYTVNEDVIWE